MRQNPHVRICGGPGSATTLVYPTSPRGRVRRPRPSRAKPPGTRQPAPATTATAGEPGRRRAAAGASGRMAQFLPPGGRMSGRPIKRTSPGSERVACVRVGFPGTREASSSPSYRPPGGGHRLTKPEAVDAAPGVRRSEAAGARMVPPGEGNEARGDGRRGVGVSHSTAEAGELSPRDPVEGRGHRQVAPVAGKTANTPRLGPVSTSRQRIAELAR